MKTKVYFGLWVVFFASCLLARADDTPAQAAARLALEQKLEALGDATPPPAPVTPASTTSQKPGESATTKTNAVHAEAAPAQTNLQTRPARVAPSWATGDLRPESATIDPTQVAPKAVASQATPPTGTTVAVAAPTAPIAAVAPARIQPMEAFATPMPARIQPIVVPATPRPTAPPAVATMPSPPTLAKSTNEIVTIYGVVYKNVQVEKVDRDGLIISYSTPDGGIGMSKVYFSDLPYAIREQYQ